MPFDDPALVRADVRKIRRVEGAELDELARQPLNASDRPVRIHDLDALPAIALICFEDRPDLDVDTGLLADLSRQRLFQPLARREEATQESPLRGTKAMARQDHVAVWIDAKPNDTDEKSRLRAVQDAPLPAHGKGVIEKGEEPKEHGDRLCSLATDGRLH